LHFTQELQPLENCHSNAAHPTVVHQRFVAVSTSSHDAGTQPSSFCVCRLISRVSSLADLITYVDWSNDFIADWPGRAGAVSGLRSRWNNERHGFVACRSLAVRRASLQNLYEWPSAGRFLTACSIASCLNASPTACIHGGQRRLWK